MNIRLTPHSEELIQEQLKDNTFHSAEEIIERALEVLADRIKAGAEEKPKRTLETFHGWIDQFTAYSERIPPMNVETFSREMIYRDHD